MAEIIIHSPASPAAGLNMEVCDSNKYYFYHKPDNLSNNPKLYAMLIQSATSYIDIWDPYFNIPHSSAAKSDSRIFSDVSSNVEIRILTEKAYSKSSTYSEDLKNAISNQLPTGSTNIRLGARFIDPGHGKTKDWIFHDRYLICDRSEVYLVGASVSSHLDPHHSTGIYKVDDPNTIDFIIGLFNLYWTQAVANELPMTNIK